MRRIILSALIFLTGAGGVFAQTGISAALGFQYGRAWVADKHIERDLTEPGILATLRLEAPVGFFARVGLLFPTELKEGDLTLSYSKYDYLLFINGGGGASIIISTNSRFAFVLDLGVSLNDLLYGGSYKENIDTSWEVKLENIGQTYSGGYKFTDVKMSEVYNDISIGLLGNLALRFYLTPNIFTEVGAAASFDFLRFKSYKFAAKFKDTEWDNAKKSFTAATLDESNHEAVFESNMKFSVFKQFTVIPSISVGFRF